MTAESRLRLVGETKREVSSTGNGNGGRYDRLDERLRVVEGDLREVKADMKHVATKADVSNLRNWMLGGVITGLLAFIWFALRIVTIVSNANGSP